MCPADIKRLGSQCPGGTPPPSISQSTPYLTHVRVRQIPDTVNRLFRTQATQMCRKKSRNKRPMSSSRNETGEGLALAQRTSGRLKRRNGTPGRLRLISVFPSALSDF